jgi:hypothetical protein
MRASVGSWCSAWDDRLDFGGCRSSRRRSCAGAASAGAASLGTSRRLRAWPRELQSWRCSSVRRNPVRWDQAGAFDCPEWRRDRRRRGSGADPPSSPLLRPRSPDRGYRRHLWPVRWAVRRYRCHRPALGHRSGCAGWRSGLGRWLPNGHPAGSLRNRRRAADHHHMVPKGMSVPIRSARCETCPTVSNRPLSGLKASRTCAKTCAAAPLRCDR